MRGRLFRQRRDMQSAKRDVRTAAPVMVGDVIRTVRGRDVDLNDNEIRCVFELSGSTCSA